MNILCDCDLSSELNISCDCDLSSELNISCDCDLSSELNISCDCFRRTVSAKYVSTKRMHIHYSFIPKEAILMQRED